MLKKDKNIAFSCSDLDAKLREMNITRGNSAVRSYLTAGMNTTFPGVPENVISWITTHDLYGENIKYHQRFVLKTVLSGKNITYLDGRRFILKPGSSILIFPYQIHANGKMEKPSDAYQILIATFTLAGNKTSLLAALKDRIILLEAEDETLLCRVAGGYQGKNSEVSAVSALSEFLARSLEKQRASKTAVAHDDVLSAICAEMREKCAEDISLKTLCRTFSVTPSTLRRMFVKRYGNSLTPGKFLSGLRLRSAAEMLLHSEARIAEIAISNGFRDQFSFSRAFKKSTGYSPLEYRKKFGEKPE